MSKKDQQQVFLVHIEPYILLLKKTEELLKKSGYSLLQCPQENPFRRMAYLEHDSEEWRKEKAQK